MKSVTALVKLFSENGFTLARQTNHMVWRCPCGRHQITSSGTHCEGRGDNNAKALMKRTLRKCAQAQEETP